MWGVEKLCVCVGGRFGLNGSQHHYSMFKVYINVANERDEEMKSERQGFMCITFV